MISDLITLIILACFGVFGLKHPHIALCGLVWVNTYKPQETSYGFLASVPISLYFTLFFFSSCLLNFSKFKAPKSLLYHFLMLALMLWISISHQFAHFPIPAAIKYESVIKTLIFIYFIPFVITDRAKLDEFLWVVIISLGTFAFFGGVKSLLGGGGYGMNLLGVRTTLFSEGSIFSNQMIATVPIVLYLSRHSEIAKKFIYFKWLGWGYLVCSIATLIGTQARSGLVCLGVLMILILAESKNKIKVIFLTLSLSLIMVPFLSDAWYERMRTFVDFNDNVSNDSSAMGRLATWRWSLTFLAENPLLGGGFQSFHANSGKLNQYVKDNEVEVSQNATAYHNILFEVAASSGLVGLALFLCILLYIYRCGKKIALNQKNREWQRSMAKACYQSMFVYCAGGMFVSYAFYPWLFYMFVTVFVLKEFILDTELDVSIRNKNARTINRKLS